ncbi:DUF1194 domain-containing protein [Thalassobaculum litoreum]|uniref:VWFA domain-containing protein n=1 Tax=Thalassobaculum litoreum DSM 18839 TaxID=1123362 RepID=A0A8G2BKZ1_9PROT|nr:DUF1194 domain-containing protein [Thalassobaculum litoreum]SDG31467.1 Protein of unknown function [Thalassobaculum litoreum DSM 18839]
MRAAFLTVLAAAGLLAATFLASGIPAPARAAEPVDLELVLAVDSSASVDYTEFNLQLQGLTLAFEDPELADAIAAGPLGAIAVTLIEWSSAERHEISIPWTVIRSGDEARAFADEISRAPRRVVTGATSISSSILFAAGMFDTNGYEGTRRVIDLSGDGYNNQGAALSVARALVLDRAITINAVAIENQVKGLGDYFEESLIGGFGAFVIRASDYEDYIGQIRRKLLREIMPAPIS